MLSRIYNSEGGSELCDVLMKYLYKGMATSQPSADGPKQSVTPQQTGFSQVQTRGTQGEGHAMSVLLSWHEKVCTRFALLCFALLDLT